MKLIKWDILVIFKTIHSTYTYVATGVGDIIAVFFNTYDLMDKN